eukprot:3065885-Pyramimonas_sp.AAC.1
MQRCQDTYLSNSDTIPSAVVARDDVIVVSLEECNHRFVLALEPPAVDHGFVQLRPLLLRWHSHGSGGADLAAGITQRLQALVVCSGLLILRDARQFLRQGSLHSPVGATLHARLRLGVERVQEIDQLGRLIGLGARSDCLIVRGFDGPAPLLDGRQQHHLLSLQSARAHVNQHIREQGERLLEALGDVGCVNDAVERGAQRILTGGAVRQGEGLLPVLKLGLQPVVVLDGLAEHAHAQVVGRACVGPPAVADAAGVACLAAALGVDGRPDVDLLAITCAVS